MLVIMALAIPVLCGGMGLIMDNGAAYRMKRELQSVADSAATAAVMEMRHPDSDYVVSAGYQDAALNGYDIAEGADVSVNRPPQYGPYAGNSSYIEVLVSDTAPLFFLGALGIDAMTPRARSVAGVTSGPKCAYSLSPSGSNAFKAQGNADVTFENCGIQVNSDSSTAITTSGAATIQATSIDVVGDYNGNGFLPTPTTGAVNTGDPFDYLEPPVFSGCDHNSLVTVKTTVTLDPGVYCGGIKFNSQARATLNPGTYVIKGEFKVNGSAEIEGEGITFFLTSDSGSYSPISMNGNSSMKITAPTDGPLKGIAFYQDPSLTASSPNTFNGGAEFDIDGALYFPTTDVKFSGNFDSSAGNMMLAANKAEFHGSPTFRALPAAMIPSMLTTAKMVE